MTQTRRFPRPGFCSARISAFSFFLQLSPARGHHAARERERREVKGKDKISVAKRQHCPVKRNENKTGKKENFPLFYVMYKHKNVEAGPFLLFRLQRQHSSLAPCAHYLKIEHAEWLQIRVNFLIPGASYLQELMPIPNTSHLASSNEACTDFVTRIVYEMSVRLPVGTGNAE